MSKVAVQKGALKADPKTSKTLSKPAKIAEALSQNKKLKSGQQAKKMSPKK